jgi:hypothetical protein
METIAAPTARTRAKNRCRIELSLLEGPEKANRAVLLEASAAIARPAVAPAATPTRRVRLVIGFLSSDDGSRGISQAALDH